MDPFDKKISKMKKDISKIDKEIKEIQKVNINKNNLKFIKQKNRLAKENLSRKIESLRINNHKIKKNPFNLKYSKLENYPVKSYRNINCKNNFNINEDNSENDIKINIIYKDKNDILNKIIDNGENNIKKGYKDVSKEDNIFNNNSNKIISENQKEKINIEIPKYNSKKHINKSNSYFVESNNLRKNKNKNRYNYIYLNDSNDKIIDYSYNDTKAYNYKKNINYFNQKNRILKEKNKKEFKHKIYYDLENFEKKDLTNNNTSDNSFESINIEDFINKVNYNGNINNFSKYLEELKLKADITNIVQNMFKNEINSYDGLDKLLEDYSKKKYKKILDMYKFLLERLIQINQNKINDKDINSFYDEIYSFNQ